MSQKRPTASIRLAIVEMTIADGETTGTVEMSVTENGRTRTMRREIGKLAKAPRVKSKDQPR